MNSLDKLDKRVGYIVSAVAPKDKPKRDPVQQLITGLEDGPPAYHPFLVFYDPSSSRWQALNTGLLTKDSSSEIVDAQKVLDSYTDGSQLIAQKTELKKSPGGSIELTENFTPQKYGEADLIRIGLKNRDKLAIVPFLQNLQSVVPNPNHKKLLQIIIRGLSKLPIASNITYGDFKKVICLSFEGLKLVNLLEIICNGFLWKYGDTDLPGEYCTELVLESLEENAEIKQELGNKNPWEVTPSALLKAQQQLAQEKPQDYSLISLVKG